MRTLTGVCLALDAGFISPQTKKRLFSLIPALSKSKKVSNKTALRFVLKDGAVTLKPVARNYLSAILEVCDD